MNPVAHALVVLSFSLPVHAQLLGEWEPSFPPNPGDGHNALHSVSAASAADAWAAGYFLDGSESLTMAVHWDGSSWQSTPTPSPKPPGDVGAKCALLAIEVVGPGDVWAAGYKTIQHPQDGVVGTQLLVMRWDGNEWSEVPAPVTPKGGTGGRVRDILAIGSDDIWFFGTFNFLDGEHHSGMAMHWDGSGFTLHPTPNVHPVANHNLSASRAADGRLWVVGMGTAEGFDGTFPYVLRGEADGSGWSIVGSWHERDYTGLHTVAAFGDDDVWIGMAERNNYTFVAYIFMHWDGDSWTEVPVPDPFHAPRLAARASDEIYSGGTNSLLRWDGQDWSIVDTFDGVNEPLFNGVSLAPDGSLFGAGRFRFGNPTVHTLAACFIPAASCYPDFTGDGALDLFDFLAYVNSFNAGSPDADCDHNVHLDLFDFLCFVNAFNAGC